MNKNIKKIIRKFLPLNLFYKIKLNIYKKQGKKTIEEKKEIISKKYKQRIGKNLNWDCPTTYTEKLNYSKVYKMTDIEKTLTDKVLVREWVISKIGERYLVPVYGVYDSFEQINFDSLPEEFVIKCNHDSGSVTICKNKKKLNMKYLKNRYNFLMKRDYSEVHFEAQYKGIIPKIIIEKYMGDNINDYKFLCFDGVPYYCWVDYNRYLNHRRNINNLDWELQPFNQNTYDNYLEKEAMEKPKKFDEMIKIVKMLCKNFGHVRVDLYVIENKIYFGEMTFTNGSGLEPIIPEEYDYKLGNLWKKFEL